jgi:hypothetical protein
MNVTILLIVAIFTNFSYGDEKADMIARFGREVDPEILNSIKEHEDSTKKCRAKNEDIRKRVEEALARQGLTLDLLKENSRRTPEKVEL